MAFAAIKVTVHIYTHIYIYVRASINNNVCARVIVT